MTKLWSVEVFIKP